MEATSRGAQLCQLCLDPRPRLGQPTRTRPGDAQLREQAALSFGQALRQRRVVLRDGPGELPQGRTPDPAAMGWRLRKGIPLNFLRN